MVRSFDKIRTKPDIEFFKRWCKGEVGFPMVDACMRFLKNNGWINFRNEGDACFVRILQLVARLENDL